MSDEMNLFNQDDEFDDEQSPFDASREVRPDGTEFWDARKLQPFMGYAQWRDFQTAIERAKMAAENSGMDVDNLFVRVRKNSGGRPQENYELARYAAYLVALNGDPRKPESAAAQSYFVIRTREAEIAPKPAELSRLDLIEIARSAEVERLALESTVAAMAPKADYVDQYVTDNDLMKLRTVAGNLNVGETWLRNKLIEKNWIYFDEDSRWSESKQCKEIRKRYSAHSDKRAYFRPVEEHKAPRFKGETMHTLKVTPRGAAAIAKVVARWKAEEAS